MAWHVPALASRRPTHPTHAWVERGTYVEGATTGIAVHRGSQCVADTRRAVMEENGQTIALLLEGVWHFRRGRFDENVGRTFFFARAFHRRSQPSRDRPRSRWRSRSRSFIWSDCGIQLQKRHPIIGTLRRSYEYSVQRCRRLWLPAPVAAMAPVAVQRSLGSRRRRLWLPWRLCGLWRRRLWLPAPVCFTAFQISRNAALIFFTGVLP